MPESRLTANHPKAEQAGRRLYWRNALSMSAPAVASAPHMNITFIGAIAPVKVS